MAIHVLMLPRIVTKGGPGGAVCLAPHFGSLDMAGRRWGQASSRLGDETTVAVWLDCSDKERDDLVAEVGGKALGTALDDANAERVKAALAVEVPPRYMEARDKALALSRRLRAFVSRDLPDAEALAEYRAIRADAAATRAVQAEVAAFDRTAEREFQAAVAAALTAAETVKG